MTDDNKLWFEKAARNVTSQYGEDGIIEAALDIIGDRTGWCVEFGAADGKHYSNSWNLIENHGYSAVLIEGDPKLYAKLKTLFAGKEKIHPVNALVGFEAADGLDSLLAKTPIPKNFDMLSVDIDGNDYYVWEAVNVYRPKLVLVEFNPTMPTSLEFVQPRDMRVQQGSSLRSITELARKKGYELVATTTSNGIYVDRPYYERFGLKDNSIYHLRKDESSVTHLFVGYDGHMFLRGYGRLPWHQLKIREHRIQVLPRFLQRFSYTPLQNRLYRIYRSLWKKHLV